MVQIINKRIDGGGSNQSASQDHDDESALPSTSVDSKVTQNNNTMDNGASFAKRMEELRDCVWYWGPISWQQSERVLADKPMGSFLLRDSTSDRYIFTISYKSENTVRHVRVPHHKGSFSFGGPSSALRDESVSQFIQRSMQKSNDGELVFMMHPKHAPEQAENIRLLHPISRLSTLPSLKHQCRFAILRCLRRHNSQSALSITNPDALIGRLPLPPNIRDYMMDSHCVAELKL